jgi:hypothetical protein
VAEPIFVDLATILSIKKDMITKSIEEYRKTYDETIRIKPLEYRPPLNFGGKE